MKFDITVRRAFSGNDIQVHVEAGDGQAVARVQTTLDGFELADDQLDSGTQVYDRAFPQAGDAGPGSDHRIVVAAFLPDGTPLSATKIWKDAI